tara:strand:- start:547 stop:972 length:426 start_codon:yes stop_codon:yes gene_type:complete
MLRQALSVSLLFRQRFSLRFNSTAGLSRLFVWCAEMALMSDCLLREALESRFTDESEVRDVASYGCVSGVSDFIYYRETIAFFDQHQSDIEQWLLDDHEFTLADFCKNAEDVDQLKNAMVWAAVDLYCQERAIYNETMKPA